MASSETMLWRSTEYICGVFSVEDDRPHNVGGKCNPSKYEVEIVIRYRRVVDNEP